MACSSGVADSVMALTLDDDRLPLHAQRTIDKLSIELKWVADLPLTTWTFIAEYLSFEYNAIDLGQAAIQAFVTSTGYIMASLQPALEEPLAFFHDASSFYCSKCQTMEDRLMLFVSKPGPSTK